MPTLVPLVETTIVGRSVRGQIITSTRVGRGSTAVALVGAIHGCEANTARLVEDLAQVFVGMANALPVDGRFFFVPRLNPDGLAENSRYNANGVDLNRNWDTVDWQTDAGGSSGVVRGSGGVRPFSEPETRAVAAWLLELRDGRADRPIVVFYHAANPPAGLVLPGYRLGGGGERTDQETLGFSQAYARSVGYDFALTFDRYEITGEAIHWCADNGIVCMDVELPSYDVLDKEGVWDHAAAILGLVQTQE
jgi:predicted deacylase